VRFEPMPSALRDALDRLEVSQVCKVALRFRDAFWDTPGFFRRRAVRGAGLQPFTHGPSVGLATLDDGHLRQQPGCASGLPRKRGWILNWTTVEH